jgi:ribosomal protein S12 methylthiotransferase accessory factor YcaO
MFHNHNRLFSGARSTQSSLHLKSAKKYAKNDGSLLTRIKSVEDTLAEIIPVSKKIGVTRTSDITCMDKLYIPNYSSILPGTEDSIWVYGGKGPTKAHAKARDQVLDEMLEKHRMISNFTR